MQESCKITNALISVFYKDGLDVLAKTLHQQGVNIYSTGGTQEFIEKLKYTIDMIKNNQTNLKNLKNLQINFQKNTCGGF